MHNDSVIYGYARYARVSTDAQDITNQVAQLKAPGCATIFREKISGATAERPQLKKLMAKLAAGDVVVILAVDRLSRDTTDLLVIARDMQRAGAGLRSISDPVVDTTSDFAELVLAILGVAAATHGPGLKTVPSNGRARRGTRSGVAPTSARAATTAKLSDFWISFAACRDVRFTSLISDMPKNWSANPVLRTVTDSRRCQFNNPWPVSQKPGNVLPASRSLAESVANHVRSGQRDVARYADRCMCKNPDCG
jgi:hypothetical protein